MVGPTQELASCTARVTFNDLPESIIHKCKQILLDSIGCALGSYALEKSRIIIEFVQEAGGNPQASIIGNRKTSAALAAFANGELINVLEYESNGPLATHVTPYVLPPCLAIAEQTQASGKALITAMALAQEIRGRVTSSIAKHHILKEEPPYFEESPRGGYCPAVFGGVAGGCKLLRFDEEKIANAFGIAGDSA